MDQLSDFLKNLFKAEKWPPRWHCGKWTTFHGWLYIISDLVIWASYFAIPLILFIFIFKKKNDVPFLKIFWLFILFILACGTTHLADAMLFWYPAYRLSGIILFLTAFISMFTVFGLIKELPRAITLRTPAQLDNIIKQRTEELEKTNSSLVKLNADIDNFVYAASHNLKSPINNIEGLLHVLKEELGNSDTAVKNITDRMDASVIRIKKSIDNLTDIIKLQKNPYEDIGKISFREVIDEVMDENKEIIKNINAKIDLKLNQEFIVYSRTGLKSIIYNLLSNSLKYYAPGRTPEIMITTLTQNSAIKFTVSDNGLGIDLSRNRDKMFVIFKRFHNHVEGSGIGLYMIKKLIEEKGGRIEVESEIDKGTKFDVIFMNNLSDNM